MHRFCKTVAALLIACAVSAGVVLAIDAHDYNSVEHVVAESDAHDYNKPAV